MGISGLTPATALINSMIHPQMIIFLPCMACGQLASDSLINER